MYCRFEYQNALELIRMRTKHYFEYIITQTPGGEATLLATQNCVVAAAPVIQ
jgi:hypothetical protein